MAPKKPWDEVLTSLELDAACLAYGRAKYLNALQGGPLEKEVADTLTRAAMTKLGTGMHSRRGVEKLVRKYFGADISKISTCKDLRCNSQRYDEYKSTVWAALRAISQRLNDALIGAGVLTAKRVAETAQAT